MTRPLPEDVARTARAYLAALVPAGEVSDAWHELVADATYWGEDELVPVVRLAHQVVLQHQPVAPQVAVLALRELGLDQPSTVARVLDVDEDTAHGWTREVAASQDDTPDPDAGSTKVGRGQSGTTSRRPSTSRPAGASGASGDPGAPDTGAASAPPADDDGAVRIGFGDDGPMTGLDDLDSPASTTPRRGTVVAAIVVALVVLLAVWVLVR